MGEETNVTNEATVETEVTTNEEVEALKAELERQKAETERFKASVNKLTKEAADKKREERAKMGEEERRKAEQEEEYIRLKEQAEADAKELNHLKAVTAYKGITEDVVEKLIDAISDKDHVAIAALINGEVEKAVKEKEAEWKRSRPGAFIGIGNAPTMTKEEILAITDPEEQAREIARHPELFSL